MFRPLQVVGQCRCLWPVQVCIVYMNLLQLALTVGSLLGHALTCGRGLWLYHNQPNNKSAILGRPSNWDFRWRLYPLGPILCISFSLVLSMKQSLGLDTCARVCMYEGGQPNTNAQTCTQTRAFRRCRQGTIIITLLCTHPSDLCTRPKSS